MDEQNEFSLRLIGYVGITISLVCLLLTVLIFCCLKLAITFLTVHHNNTYMYDGKRVMKHRPKENERMRGWASIQDWTQDLWLTPVHKPLSHKFLVSPFLLITAKCHLWYQKKTVWRFMTDWFVYSYVHILDLIPDEITFSFSLCFMNILLWPIMYTYTCMCA